MTDRIRDSVSSADCSQNRTPEKDVVKRSRAVYEQRISPLFAFIFYPPFKLEKKSVCMKRI